MKKCERKTLCASTTGHCTVKRPALQVTYIRKRPQIERMDYIKADLHLLFLNNNHSNVTNLFFALRADNPILYIEKNDA